ncbi:small nuclear ribonucleoprotein G isoform X1 [Pongo pygmaeus]|uniref:small nuclear ribonucleoprotein G isoform X1 n=1 Tax=Pongo pygmaeus TaxID=9600 RepID=UPI00300D13C7
MSKAHPPELKKFMDKKLSLKLNGGRHVQGILRGFDPFMNLVIDECVEMATSGQQNNIGMVVSKDTRVLLEISFFFWNVY